MSCNFLSFFWMPDFSSRLEYIRITSLTITMSPTPGTRKHILKVLNEWVSVGSVPAKAFGHLWRNEKCLHPESKKATYFYAIPCLHFSRSERSQIHLLWRGSWVQTQSSSVKKECVDMHDSHHFESNKNANIFSHLNKRQMHLESNDHISHYIM